MPFTFSHPAAVLPLLRGLRARGPLVASALVAGSMAPDLPFFAESWCPGVYSAGNLTHRLWAVPTLDVALAAGLVGGWQAVLRQPLLGLLPPPWAEAAEAATARRPEAGPTTGSARRRAAWFALSAALGAAGHVGWDAFTHPGRAGVRLFPVLERRVAGVPLCTVAQYGSSALALAGLGGYLLRELHPLTVSATEPVPGTMLPVDRPRRRRRALVAAAGAIGAAHRVVHARGARGPGERPDLVADLCFGAGAGVLAAAAVLGAAQRLAGPTPAVSTPG
ncbi:DUF4184 family protein [Kitasatospora kifunensis]|uniref:DUF4184 family protein n=1 Tax=Kitasatospora kifunensis TaxID=58351 RepID=A0A7W7VTN8_KITKI|nr:DUF4184 family protein [Kitasatospora kifunensis]MBB4921809.1 hypothetical protein [Kitasatospora kifunensis]